MKADEFGVGPRKVRKPTDKRQISNSEVLHELLKLSTYRDYSNRNVITPGKCTSDFDLGFSRY